MACVVPCPCPRTATTRARRLTSRCPQMAPSCAPPAMRGLGQVLPPGGVEDFPVPTLPGPAVIVTEDEARRREQEAFERGRETQRGQILWIAAATTLVGIAVSGAVGYALGR